jgi:uncharacterized protein YjiS (DUF1127 family)
MGRRQTRLKLEKESQMASIKIISQKLANWRRYRHAVRELSSLTDRELADIGISRCDIQSIAHEAAAA